MDEGARNTAVTELLMFATLERTAGGSAELRMETTRDWIVSLRDDVCSSSVSWGKGMLAPRMPVLYSIYYAL